MAWMPAYVAVPNLLSMISMPMTDNVGRSGAFGAQGRAHSGLDSQTHLHAPRGGHR
jgi:hypothetical protein